MKKNAIVIEYQDHLLAPPDKPFKQVQPLVSSTESAGSRWLGSRERSWSRSRRARCMSRNRTRSAEGGTSTKCYRERAARLGNQVANSLWHSRPRLCSFAPRDILFRRRPNEIAVVARDRKAGPPVRVSLRRNYQDRALSGTTPTLATLSRDEARFALKPDKNRRAKSRDRLRCSFR